MNNYTFSESADETIKGLSKRMEKCGDFVLRHIKSGDYEGYIAFIKNITDRKYIADRIITPLTETAFDGDFERSLQCVSLKSVSSCDEIINEILSGNAVCLMSSGEKRYAVSCAADAIKTRSIGEPNSDVSIKGPKAGFVESAEENTAQLRRIIRSEKLKTEIVTVGEISKTNVVIAYVEGRADERVVKQIKDKLATANVPYVVDSGNIEMIFEKKHTAFLPSFGSTEKTDKAASKLLSGRVAVICDGSPFILTAPFLFTESLQSTDDYLRSPYYSSFIRILRTVSLAVSLLLPAVFIALMNYHKYLIPDKYLKLITEKDEGIPFSVSAEVLFMLLAFEIIKEVGVRMPRTIGDTVGIVASLILGDAAVEAGLASTIVIIIVAVSAICAFVTPAFINAVSILRLIYFFCAFSAGFYGIFASLTVSFVLLARKKSFGTPYLYPVYPFRLRGMLDTFICIPKKVLGRKELS